MPVTIQGTNSSAAPAITSDNDSGLVVGSDEVFLAIGGAKKVTVDSGGQLLLGTTTEGQATYGDALTIERAQAGMSLRCTGTDQSTHIYFADGTSGAANYAGYVQYDHSTDRLAFGAGASKRISISADGLLFGTDTAAANALDDFEEGSWTPGYSSGGATTLSVSATGRYVKIARQVFARFEIKTSNTASVTGDIGLTGLPFSSADDSVYGQVCFSFVRDWSGDFGANLRGSVNNNATTVSLLKQASNADEVTTHVQGSDMVQANAAENYLTGVVIYLAAA